ncbi:hypothetical protein MKX03_030997 [Papaver bracteatum]|nr:hypothetical protein MKX03_030997 [Papaver bracteatum]
MDTTIININQFSGVAAQSDPMFRRYHHQFKDSDFGFSHINWGFHITMVLFSLLHLEWTTYWWTLEARSVGKTALIAWGASPDDVKSSLPVPPISAARIM